MSDTVTALMWFVAVVAAIPLVLWLLKRTPLGAGGGGGMLRHVAVLPLSGSQRVVTIEVGHGDTRRWLVLGVTPHSISTLHTMAPQGESTVVPTPTATFAQLLSRLRKDEGRSSDAR